MPADFWNLPEDVQAVIEFRHTPKHADSAAAVVAIMVLVDMLCRAPGMGYDYDELPLLDFQGLRAWDLLERVCRKVRKLDVAQLAEDLDTEAGRIRWLIPAAFRG
jgi:hypothetical protein